MDDIANRSLNPWVSMWTQPRTTIQQIICENNQRPVLLLAALLGFSQMLDRAGVLVLGGVQTLPVLLVSAAISGALVGITALYVSGYLLYWTGKLIGGKGSARDIRAAIAWSGIPIIWALLLLVPELILLGDAVFSADTPREDAGAVFYSAYLMFYVIELIIGVWAFVLLLLCVAQVQDFSVSKALVNIIIASPAVIVLALMLMAAVLLLI